MPRVPPVAPACPDCRRKVGRRRPHACPSRALECVRGHPWEGNLVERRDGSRYCRACNLARHEPVRGRNGGPTCYRGHPKASWSWRFVRDRRGGHWRCHACRVEGERRRRGRAA